MFPNTISLNLSFSQKLKDDSSNSNASLIFIKKGTNNNKQNSKTNFENYPNKYFKNKQYILTNLYNSIKENMQKNREKKENLNKEDKKILSFPNLEKLVYKSFKNYYNNNFKYNVMKIDEIINNDKSHLVAEFKDFLVIGDMGEFILKYYNKKEVDNIYKQILDYYNENLFIFPNYVALYESKYIYNSIQKKQKIIDIQEELIDNQKDEKNKKEKMEKQKENQVFSVKEIDSILNETNTSGIRRYFGISDNSVENGIDKNEKQLFELIDKISTVEKNSAINKSIKSTKPDEKKLYLKGNISNGNNKNISKDKSNILNQKEKLIKGRNEKFNIYSQDKSKSISDLKIAENKTLKHNNNFSQTNLYLKKKSNTKIVFMNSIHEKNNSKETKKLKEMLEKEIKMNDLAAQTNKKIIEKFYSKENNKSLFNKIMNKTKNFSLFQENNEYNTNNNGMNKSHQKIIINKTILKDIGNNKNKSNPNMVYPKRNKKYKKELMNFLFSSKTGLNNSNKLKYKDNKIDNKIYNTSRIDNNFVTSTITDDRSTIMVNNQMLKNGQIYFNFKKEKLLNNKNNLSNSCQNIIIKPYNAKNKKFNFNKTNYNFFQNRNISYKLIKNNITGDNYNQKKIDKIKNNCVGGSYSVKGLNKKRIMKPSESLKYIHKTKAKSRQNYKNIKSNTLLGKTNLQINAKKSSSALTDRKNISEINNNLEKIDALSRNIQKIKENLKKTMDSNKYSLSTLLFNQKSKPILSKKTKEKIMEQNKKAINVYLINRTRNKSRKDIISNNGNFSTFKLNTVILSDTIKKEKENEFHNKTNFKTINNSNSKQNLNINNQKNTIDLFKEYTIMNYTKK